MDFATLPDNVFLQIFRYLPLEDRVRLGRVNSAAFRRMSKLAVSETKTLHIRDFGGGGDGRRRFTPEAVSALLNLCASSLEEILFDLSLNWEDEKRLLKAFADFRCPNLNTLYCNNEGGAEIMHAILRNCPNLVHLVCARRAARLFITFSHPSDVTSENLQSLRCYCDPRGFRSLTGRVPNLKRLHVEGSWHDAWSPAVVFEMDRFFSTVPHLERLAVTASDNVTCLHLERVEGGSNSLWRLNQLTELTLACKLTDQDHVQLENHVLAKVAGSFPRLRVLYLDVNGGITDRGLTLLAASLPDLRELTFDSNYPSRRSSAGIRALAAKCGRLQKLRFTRDGPCVCDDVLIELVHSCPSLSQVDAWDVVRIDYPYEAGRMLESLAVLEKGRSITITLHTGKKRRGLGIWRSPSVREALEKLKAEHQVTVQIELPNITEPSDDERLSDLEDSGDESPEEEWLRRCGILPKKTAVGRRQ